jgi:IS5 family transposase
LLHGNETRVWGDQGYQGQTAVIHARAPNAKDFTNRRYRFHGQIKQAEKAKNRKKSRVRAKVEHVFGVMKDIFGFKKTRYRGLAKNLNRLEVTAALPRRETGPHCAPNLKSLPQPAVMTSTSELP